MKRKRFLHFRASFDTLWKAELNSQSNWKIGRVGAFLLLLLNGMVWLICYILSWPFVLFHWLKRIFVKP